MFYNRMRGKTISRFLDILVFNSQTNSNHHSKYKRNIIKRMTERALRICELEPMNAELHHVKKTLPSNGYHLKNITLFMSPVRGQEQTNFKRN